MRLSRWRYYLSSIPALLRGVRGWPGVLARLALRAPAVVELRPSGLRFEVRSLLELWIVKETCLDREYERASVPLADGWTIVDVGAGIGEFAVDAASRVPHGRVLAFEPAPESFALLERNVERNRIANARLHALAVTARTGEVELRRPSREAAQSVAATGREADGGGAARVPSTTLERVFRDEDLERCDFLKIDCEGAEYEILFATPAATLAKIRHVCLEYHDGVTPWSHRDLVRFFEHEGFRVRLTPSRAHADLGLLHAERRC